MRHLYLAAYDVECSPRQRVALKLVRGFAIGGQKSVHECLLSDGERRDLLAAMQIALEPDKDRFLLLRLDPRSCVFFHGIAVPPAAPSLYYFG